MYTIAGPWCPIALNAIVLIQLQRPLNGACEGVKPFLKTEHDRARAETPPGCGHLFVRERLLPICVVRFTTIKFHAVNALINARYWTPCGMLAGAVVVPERTKP